MTGTEHLETLLQISRRLNSVRNEQELLAVLAQPAQAHDVQRVTLYYVENSDAGVPVALTVAAVWAPPAVPTLAVGTRLLVADYDRMLRDVIQAPDDVVLVADTALLEAPYRPKVEAMDTRAMVIVPLRQAERWVGLLAMSWDRPREFAASELELYRALIGLGAPAVENLRLLSQLTHKVSQQQLSLQTYQQIVEQAGHGIIIADADGQITYANQAACDLLGYERHELIGLRGESFWLPEELDTFQQYTAAHPDASSYRVEAHQRHRDGHYVICSLMLFGLARADGRSVAFLYDISERRAAEQERERLQAEIIEAQQARLEELSTPIIPVMDRIIVMPLVGSIDATRSRSIMRTLMAGIGEYRADVAIIDITGVPIVDTNVAQHLNLTIQAARLKGTHTIVTGMSESVAETIVDLGINWDVVETLRDLQSGLLRALEWRGIHLDDSRQ